MFIGLVIFIGLVMFVGLAIVTEARSMNTPRNMTKPRNITEPSNMTHQTKKHDQTLGHVSRFGHVSWYGSYPANHVRHCRWRQGNYPIGALVQPMVRGRHQQPDFMGGGAEVIVGNGESQACQGASTHLDQDLSTLAGFWGERPRSEDR